MEDPGTNTALLPPPPTTPVGGWIWLAPLLLLSAWLLLWPVSAHPGALLPGDALHPDGPGTFNYAWLVQREGLTGAAHSAWLYWPDPVDRLVMDGFPLDALACRPLLAVLGWPAGFTVFVLFCLWAAGLAMAWWAGAWWRSPLAALVAGVAYQSSHILLLELIEGRTTQVFAAIWVPLALGMAWRALVLPCPAPRRVALLAGLFTGLAALSWWYLLFLLGLGMLVLVCLARPWAPALRTSAWLTAGTGVLLALPLAYTLLHLEQQTGLDLAGNTAMQDAGLQTTLVAVTAMRSLQASWHGGLPLQPFFLVLVLAGVLHLPRQRWAAPLLLVLLGGALALGPAISLGGWVLPGPYRLVLEIPLLRRWWWPVRAMLLVAPGLALLAGGGASRLLRGRRGLAPFAAGGLLLESFLVMPQLPLPSLPGQPTNTANILAEGSGPTLVLPFPSGRLRTDTLPLLDQIHHGRPLVEGPLPPDSPLAPAATRVRWQDPGLAALVACESDPRTPPTLTPPVVWSALAQVGVHTVYVNDLVARRHPLGEVYLACINRLLGAPTAMREPYRIHGRVVAR